MKKKTLSIYNGRVLAMVQKRLDLVKQKKTRLSHADIDRLLLHEFLSPEEAANLHRLLG